MIWLRMFWWMTWRGAVSGAGMGALFGTVIALWLGTIFGAFYGAILGIATGFVSGLALTIMTRIWFSASPASPNFKPASVTVTVVATALTSLLLLVTLMGGSAFLVIVPTIIPSVVSGLIARRFPQYVADEYSRRDYPEIPEFRKAQIYW